MLSAMLESQAPVAHDEGDIRSLPVLSKQVPRAVHGMHGKARIAADVHSLTEALDWLKKHPQVVGTIIVIAGVVYVVSTGGSGALVLLPLGA
jgi:hypothetical protein